MNKFSVIGIDLAKAHWQIHVENTNGKVSRMTLTPAKTMNFLANTPPSYVGMEVCGGAHFWARRIQALGHEVRLIPPQFVRAYALGNHNDVNDAEAIAEATKRKNLRFVPIKQEENQDLQNLHRIRERIKQSRVALSNQIRGILYEYGITIRQGDFSLRTKLLELLEERQLSSMLLEELAHLREEFLSHEERLKRLDKKLESIAKNHDVCKRLMTIPGIGPLNATMALAMIDPSGFRNGRHVACWVGLVPGHIHTGGPTKKKIMLGITKRGDCYFRTLLIQGARAWLLSIRKKDTPEGKRARLLVEAKGFNKAAVIIANRNARIIWALMSSGETYNAAKAA